MDAEKYTIKVGDLCILKQGEDAGFFYVYKIEPADKPEYWNVSFKTLDGRNYSIILSTYHLQGEDFTVNSAPHSLVAIIKYPLNVTINESPETCQEYENKSGTNKIKPSKKEMDGIGYCTACGKMTKFEKIDNKWECQSCGYRNPRIFDKSYRK